MPRRNPFTEFSIDIRIPALPRLTGAQKKAIRAAYDKADNEKALTYHCAVAEAANEAFGAVYDDRRDRVVKVHPVEFPGVGVFRLNDQARARFGLDAHNRIYLSVSLIDENHPDRTYKLIWRDAAVPQQLAQVAVQHDRGDAHDGLKVRLELADAEVFTFRRTKDKRPYDDKRREGKNADHKAAPGRRRVHRRVADCDVERVY